MTNHKCPENFSDVTNLYFAPGDGSAFERKEAGLSFLIRSRYTGQDADLDPEEFKEGQFMLSIQAPRGFGGNKIKLQEIVSEYGKKTFSEDFDKLVGITADVIAAASEVCVE